ncbi:hypothetical protein MD484_g4174, partial [Candolleomyces efflorescens]
MVEANIMVGTHADSLIAEAVLKNVSGLTTQQHKDRAWEAVWKDCNVPPMGDWERQYDDREEFVDCKVRADLSFLYNVPGKGLAKLFNKPKSVLMYLYVRAMNVPFNLFNDQTMEARNQDGSWAASGEDEGDKWAYSFDVVYNAPEVIAQRGGRVNFVKSLEERSVWQKVIVLTSLRITSHTP